MALLTIAVSASAFARTAISPLQEPIRTALSLSDNQMALLQGPALAVPLVAASIPIGLLIDRYTRVRLLLLFALVDVAGNLLTAAASSLALLFTARCLVGVAVPATVITALSLLADLYAPAQRGRATMAISIGQVAGMSGAFALGGALAAAFPSVEGGWRFAVCWLTAPLVLGTLLILAMREPARTGIAVARPSVREAGEELWRHRALIMPLLVSETLVGIADTATLIWAAPSLSRRFALTPDRAGVLMAAGLLVSGVLGPIAGGTIADVCQRTGGPHRTMGALAALALFSLPAGLFALMPGVASAGVLLIVFITSGSAIGVTSSALATVVIPNEVRGLCMSLLSAAGAIFAIGLSPLAVSLLSGAIGGTAMIGTALVVVCVVTSLAGAMTFALGRRYFLHATT